MQDDTTAFSSQFVFKALRLFIYLRTNDASRVVEYLGRTSLKLKTPFKNLQTKGNSPNGISFSVLIMVDKTDVPVLYYEQPTPV